MDAELGTFRGHLVESRAKHRGEEGPNREGEKSRDGDGRREKRESWSGVTRANRGHDWVLGICKESLARSRGLPRSTWSDSETQTRIAVTECLAISTCNSLSAGVKTMIAHTDESIEWRKEKKV